MGKWQFFAPVEGWDSFIESAALTEALWTHLPLADWHYLNFTSENSTWESRKDASMIRLHYAGARVVELTVQSGAASESVRSLISRFGLVPISDVA